MHLPDHVLDPTTAVGTAVLSAATAGYCFYKVRSETRPTSLVAIAATAACVFAAQMLNFPISASISGHVLGGLAAAVVLGPWLAMLAMSVVVAVQCFLFQDGGVTSLGANLLNMAVIAPLAGYSLFSLLRKQWSGYFGTLASATVAAWLSVQLAALLCAVELTIGGQVPFAQTISAMLASHSLIGIGEACATGTVLAVVFALRPDLVHAPTDEADAPRAGYQPLAGLLVALALAAFVAPWASSSPDGLEAAMSSLGFHADAAPVLASPFPDYEVAALGSWGLAVSTAGILGTIAVFLLASSLAAVLPAERESHAV